jgi:hypothetical protein
MVRCLLILLGLIVVADGAWAQAKRPLTAAEMQALLAKGLMVTSTDPEGGKKFTGQVNLQAGGKLTGTLSIAGHGSAALNGTWKLNGARLCRTLGQVQPEEVCETWLRVGNAKEVTVQVDGKDASINRWQ